MAWAYLIIAALFECGWAIGLKHTNGFTKIWPSIFTIAAMIVSFQFLSLAMKTIPVGTAYATWTGIGTVGVAIIGMMLFVHFFHDIRLILDIKHGYTNYINYYVFRFQCVLLIESHILLSFRFYI